LSDVGDVWAFGRSVTAVGNAQRALKGKEKAAGRIPRRIEDFPGESRLANRYAAVLKTSISCSQLVSGFHLGQIWATISKSLILHG